jgi:hypothetical protein
LTAKVVEFHSKGLEIHSARVGPRQAGLESQLCNAKVASASCHQ